MLIKGFDEIIREHFDVLDTDTRKTLLALDEADQNSVLQSLTSKLYDDIVDKVDDIDFGSISISEGDFTKIDNYENLCQCIDTMRNLLIQYKQDTEPIDTIITAIDNLKQRKDMFERGFKLRIEVPSLIYCTVSLAVVSSVSFMISSCIEYVKTPNNDEFSIIIDRVGLVKTKSNLLFNNLRRFNKMCSSGELDKTMEYIIKSNTKNFMGLGIYAGAVLGAGVAVFFIKNLIPLLRELIFFFYYSRTRASDYFEIQSELLQMNAYNLNTSVTMAGRSQKDINNVKNKQLKIADRFKKISNFFSIKGKESEVHASRDIKQSASKKYKLNDVVDSAPDSAGISTSLF